MANYGFLIDQSKCIGCHACSTACKAENQVPLGVYRTWVKYVEIGAYPDVRRHFQVTRCNHCANPPCVRICPVTAMYQRSDGIVEFDPSICIGCKSCIQACPYDAVYLDPETNAAAKCTFCAHRIEVGLEPACVVVCPEHAILAGDMDDPASEISKKLAISPASVLKPEHGTSPKLFYIHGSDWTMRSSTVATTNTTMWADRVSEQGASMVTHPELELPVLRSKSGAIIQSPKEQGLILSSPTPIGGSMAGQMVQTGYNAQHKLYWHWELPTYLVTKSISGGLFMLLGLGAATGLISFDPLIFLQAGFTGLVFMLITAILLIKDLSQPKRFLNILLHPQWESWVARGAYIIVGFTAIAGLWWLLEGSAYLGWLSIDNIAIIRPLAGLISMLLSFAVVMYSPNLFGQAEGRDLWQSSILPLKFFVQSIAVASGILLIFTMWSPTASGLQEVLMKLLPAFLIINLFLTMGYRFSSNKSENAKLAAREMTDGRLKKHFWWGGVFLGHEVPLILLLMFGVHAMPAAVICLLVGVYLYEYAFVMAPQLIPNS